MKTLKLTLLFVFLWFMSYNQNSNKIDSLKNLIPKLKQDSLKVNVLVEISNFYIWSEPDSTIKYADEGLQLVEKSKLFESQIRLLLAKGEALAGKGNYPEALEIQFRALKISDKMDNDFHRMEALFFIGAVYFYSNDFHKALQYSKQARTISEKINQWEDYTLGFIGETYYNMGLLDSSLVYIQQSYDLTVKNNSQWCIPYYFMAAIKLKKGDFTNALEYYRAGLRLDIPALDSIKGFIGLASVFKEMEMSDSTIFYAQKALLLGQRTSFNGQIIEACAQLKNIYQSKNLIDSAFKYQEIMDAAKDSFFNQEKIKQIQNITFKEQVKQKELEASILKFRNQLNTSVLIFALIIFFIIGIMLWRRNQFKQQAFELLQKQKKETEQQKDNLEVTLSQLKATQSQLIQSEKMASLGELTAGIAHEIQNPLNFVNNFSEVSNELIVEIEEERAKNPETRDEKLVTEILTDIKQNLEKISHHGKRAADIVKGMLQHSRSSSGVKEPTDINALSDEYLRLAYHGLRAKDKSFNATMVTDFDETLPKINVITQDIGRVILNLITNAFYAVQTSVETQHAASLEYQPTVWLSTKKLNGEIRISVKDNGPGIPAHILDKIFQPFFTTKPTGQGTGLGLSLAYDIVKAHGGELKVETKEGEGSEFIIQLPVV